MFHKAVEMKFLKGTAMEVRFQDGSVKKYDISVLFKKISAVSGAEGAETVSAGETDGGIWHHLE